MKKDSKGRITNVMKNDALICTKNGVNIYGGHSVCVSCGKDMPGCWDTVCSVCGNTSCYDCSHSDTANWFCKKHNPTLISIIKKFFKTVSRYSRYSHD